MLRAGKLLSLAIAVTRIVSPALGSGLVTGDPPKQAEIIGSSNLVSFDCRACWVAEGFRRECIVKRQDNIEHSITIPCDIKLVSPCAIRSSVWDCVQGAGSSGFRLEPRPREAVLSSVRARDAQWPHIECSQCTGWAGNERIKQCDMVFFGGEDGSAVVDRFTFASDCDAQYLSDCQQGMDLGPEGCRVTQ